MYKDQYLSLLVPLAQHLEEAREAVFLGANFHNLLNIRVNNTATPNLGTRRGSINLQHWTYWRLTTLPTWISTGSMRIFLASVSTCRGNVALNKTV